MQQLSRAEQNGKEMSALMKKDYELSEDEKSQKIKEMGKSQRQWKQEKDELVWVIPPTSPLENELGAIINFVFPFTGDDRYARKAAAAIQIVERRHWTT